MPQDPRFDDPICKSCISRYRVKHPGEAWQIPCEGIVTDIEKIYPAEQLEDLSPQDRKHLEYVHDSVLWARERLRWEAYPYQEEELLCSSRRTVLRFGRQTGKTDVVSVKVLHRIALNPHQFQPAVKVLGVVPHDAQADNIYTRVLELAENDATIWNRLDFKKTPFRQVVCKGTGRFYLFCAGTAAKKGASTVRGQPADEVFMDEADYLGPEDWTTIMPIVNSKDTNRFTMCSTPIEQRGRLYRHCHDPAFRETHITIYDKPGVTEQQLQFARNECDTEMDWILEYLAEFGDTVQGVYKPEAINRSLTEYELGDFDRDMPIYVGVDWNKAAVGDWIAIIGDTGHQLRLVDLIGISAKDSTHISAVQRIAAINRMFPNVRGIYCDDGHGETQLELLWAMGREAARDHPDRRLLKSVVSVDFARQFEIYSQLTNTMKLTKTKPYMTNRSAGYLEEGLVGLPKSQDEKDLLVHQMRNYSGVKRTATGMPVYSDGNQHCLIAWQLAMFCYDQLDGSLSRRPAPSVPLLKIPARRTPDQLESKPVVAATQRSRQTAGIRSGSGRSRATRGTRAQGSRALRSPRSRALNR